MAIKGKKKSRGRPRVVATAPRPFLVRPKTPLLRRKSMQLVLILLLEGIIAAFAIGYRISRDDAAHTSAVQEFGGGVDSFLQGNGVGQPIPGAVLVLPEMAQSVAQLREGQGDTKVILANAKSWEEAANRTAEQIGSLEVELAQLKAARLSMRQGLQMYAAVSANLQVAAELEGRPQKDLLDNLGVELQVAAEVFDTGYQLLQEERRKAELVDPSLGGFPGGGEGVPGLPGGVPGLPGGG
jgi:hypothetical protein